MFRITTLRVIHIFGEIMFKRNHVLDLMIPATAGISLFICSNITAGEFPNPNESDPDLKLLGKYVFFDKISRVNVDSGATSSRMGCVTCHDPEAGGTYFVAGINKHQVGVTGANPHTQGGRKPPTNAYASFAKPFISSAGIGGPVGGNFWDGRSIGADDPFFTDGSNKTTTEHIGLEIFTGLPNLDYVDGYEKYFGPTTDQALNPMPNPVEQNIDEQTVCEVVAASSYAPLYEKTFGMPIDCSGDPVSVAENGEQFDPYQLSFRRLMLAVGAYQHSSDINSFSSKRDYALYTELMCRDGILPTGLWHDIEVDTDSCDDLMAAKVALAEELTTLEQRQALVDQGVAIPIQVAWARFPLGMLTVEENFGHDLFYGEINEGGGGPVGPPPQDIDGNGLARNVSCSFCHANDGGGPPGAPVPDGTDPFELYTEQRFHNIGLPANPALDSDPGLSGVTLDTPVGVGFGGGPPGPRVADPGWFRNMTLRNVDKRPGEGFTKAYMHNGVFKSLESVVHFYNTGFTPGATAGAYGISQCEEKYLTEKEMLKQNCWPAPEFEFAGPTGLPNAFGGLSGNMGMTPEEEAAIVVYMQTLSDMHTAKAPKPYKAK